MTTTHGFGSSFLESQPLCRQFTFSEIQLATQNLDESFVIGRGGFGKVYKGIITTYGSNILTTAIKRLDSTSTQGASEFWAEVNMLSNLRHCHLVPLIGYCNEGIEMILVYQYMSNGTLADHLHKRQTLLSWVQRLTICIGAARGLDYLHTGTGIKQGIIHRDVKSSNILLHSNWAAKISDFGLSKICPRNRHTTYINTGVKGTYGYLDPDYFYTGKLTRKSDVYAFGVVLFEVLCGKRAVDSSLDGEHCGLAIWAQESIEEGRLKQIVETNIREEVFPKCLKLFAKLAKSCLHKNLKQRPTMAEVVVGLESILAIQVKAKNALQPTSIESSARKAPKIKFISNEDSGARSLESLELYFDTIGGENQTLHRLDLDTLLVATENFCEANKISEQTSGPLYKGKLQNGHGIAVAKHSYCTKHTDYMMNEASILVKLEHENVAKLVGYCFEGTRLFLVYNFALHSTLDPLMFDPKCTILKWDERYKIILGVAKALLYLHRDAPIQIIHRDVKPGNILLDENLNLVLSSFWSAKSLTINETQCGVSEIYGTWGYKEPVYYANSSLSTKVDVYSLGVLVLEMITGCRAMLSNVSIEYVQKNWFERTLSNIIDPRIDVDSSSITRYVEIGLLCVQKDEADRPTVEEVVSMLLDNSSLIHRVLKMRAMVIEECSIRNSATVDHNYDTSDEDHDTDAVYHNPLRG